MCGILGFLCTNPQHQVTSQQVEAALDLLHHRGPDGHGTFVDKFGRAGLGHTRLSIIDLSTGAQPISNEDNTIHIVVNGEFYGYKEIQEDLKKRGHTLKTQSDSEIALHLYEEYGTAFVEHLRGEYSICIWDENLCSLIVVRDRFGIKPLYYTWVNGTLMIASEIKAFLGMGWEAEWDMGCLIQTGWICDNHRTLFKGVSKLPPGHYLIATLTGTSSLHRYWDFDYPNKTIKDNRPVEEMIEGVRERLLAAISDRLVADVPVGVYLSGGIDSATCLGMAAHLIHERQKAEGKKPSLKDANMRAFTIAFVDDDNYNELPIAQRLAESLDCPLESLKITERGLVDNLEDAIWHAEQPLLNLNTVAKFMLSQSVRSHGYKVVLTGEGSDEIFAGYGWLLGDFFRDPSVNMFACPEDDRTKLFDQFKNVFSPAHKGLLDLPASQDSKVERTLNLTQITGIPLLNAIPASLFRDSVYEVTGRQSSSTVMDRMDSMGRSKARSSWHSLHGALYFSAGLVLPNVLLTTLGDRMEMAHSVEGRVPFLDHRLVEYVNMLPETVKIRYPDSEKWILREAVKPFVTEELYKRKKMPFLAPPPSIAKASAALATTENGVKPVLCLKCRDEIKNKEMAPLDALFCKLVTKEAVEKLGFANWDKVKSLLPPHLRREDTRAVKPNPDGAEKTSSIQCGNCSNKLGPEDEVEDEKEEAGNFQTQRLKTFLISFVVFQKRFRMRPYQAYTQHHHHKAKLQATNTSA